MDSVIIADSKGMKIVSVYLIEPTNLFYILSEKSKNIKRPADLKGKKIGLISSASGSYPNLLIILNLSNMSINDVVVVQAGTAVVPSFLERKVDAVAVHLSQKLLIEERGLDLNVIYASDYTNVSTGCIVVTKDLIKSKPELIKKFLKATKKGLEYAINNPEKAVDIYLSYYPEAVSKRKSNIDMWNEFIENFRYKERIPSLQFQDSWEKTQDLLYAVGIITTKTNVSEMYSNDFFPP